MTRRAARPATSSAGDDDDLASADVFASSAPIAPTDDDDALLVDDKLAKAEIAVKTENVEKDEEFQIKSEKDKSKDVDGEVVLTKEERYTRLMDLLSRSKFYSQYIRDKMENSEEADKIKEKNTKLRKKIQENEEEEPPAPAKGRGRGKGKKVCMP